MGGSTNKERVPLFAIGVLLGKKHLIGPVELYAVVTARALWRNSLTGQELCFSLTTLVYMPRV